MEFLVSLLWLTPLLFCAPLCAQVLLVLVVKSKLLREDPDSSLTMVYNNSPGLIEDSPRATVHQAL